MIGYLKTILSSEKEKSNLYKVYYFFLLFFVFTLPYGIQLSNLAMMGMGVCWLGGMFFDRKNFGEWDNYKHVLLFCGIWLLDVFSLAYTENMEEGQRIIFTKIPLLLFPLIFGITKPLKGSSMFHLLIAFVAGEVVSTFFCYGNGFFMLFWESSFDYFFIENFVSLFDIHRVYYSTYLLFAIYVMLIFFVFGLIKKKNYTVAIGAIVLMLLAIFLMASRIMLALAIASLPMYIVYQMVIVKKYYKMASSLIVGFLVLVIALVIFVKPINSIMMSSFDVFKGGDVTVVNGPNQRPLFWKSAIEVWKPNFLTGVGIGDTQDELQQVYKQNKYTEIFQGKFNAHNVIIQTGMSVGIIGVVYFLLINCMLLINALKSKDWIAIVFMIIVWASFMTESVLLRTKGVSFYAFFTYLFYFYNVYLIEHNRKHY